MKILKLLIGNFSKANIIGSIAATIMVLGEFFAPPRVKVFTTIFPVLLVLLSMWFAYNNPSKKERTKKYEGGINIQIANNFYVRKKAMRPLIGFIVFFL